MRSSPTTTQAPAAAPGVRPHPAAWAGARRSWLGAAGGALGAALLAACGAGPTSTQPVPGQGTARSGAAALRSLSGTVKIDGSSTVFPISEAMAEEFQKATGGQVRVTVGISGTGGGFKKFCADETDISDASRPILAAEIDLCKTKEIQFIELPVAFDGISLIVSPKNTFVDSIKVSELRKMWEPAAQGVITRWSQVRPEWPDRPFRLFGPGADSGTFDYFTDAVNGKEKASRGDYTASEDDNVLVQGIANDPDALGYFGYAYYVENKSKLKLVKVDAEKGAGAIAPSPEAILNGVYTPLSRPLFVYPKLAAVERPEVREFLRFYLDVQNNQLIKQVGYVPFAEKYYQMARQRLDARQVGTVFPGKTVENVKIDDLFGKTPALP